MNNPPARVTTLAANSKVHPLQRCQGLVGSISVTAGNLIPPFPSSRPHHPLSRHQFDFTRLPTTTDVNLDDTHFRICHWQIPTFTQGRLHQHTSLPWSTGKHMNQLAARMQRQRQRHTPLHLSTPTPETGSQHWNKELTPRGDSSKVFLDCKSMVINKQAPGMHSHLLLSGAKPTSKPLCRSPSSCRTLSSKSIRNLFTGCLRCRANLHWRRYLERLSKSLKHLGRLLRQLYLRRP